MNVARRTFLVALAIGLGWWLARRDRSPASDTARPAASQAAPTASAAVSSASPPVFATPGEIPKTDADERLLRDIAALSAEFDRLRASPDDLDNFRRSADLENEFMAMLDADTAALLVREMPPGFSDTRFGVLSLIRWAAADRSGASAWMAAHPGATPSSAEALARGWWAEDPVAVAAHLDALAPGPWRSSLALTAAEDAFLGKDPGSVLALLDRATPDDSRRLLLVEWNATAWAIRDTEAAAAWAAREPDPARREKLLAAVAIGEANHDPASAASRLSRTVADPAALAPALKSVARLWAVRDPAAAARWAEALPAGPFRDAAEEHLLAILSP